MKEHSTQKLFWKKWPYKAIIRISAHRGGSWGSGYSYSRRNSAERTEEFNRLKEWFKNHLPDSGIRCESNLSVFLSTEEELAEVIDAFGLKVLEVWRPDSESAKELLIEHEYDVVRDRLWYGQYSIRARIPYSTEFRTKHLQSFREAVLSLGEGNWHAAGHLKEIIVNSKVDRYGWGQPLHLYLASPDDAAMLRLLCGDYIERFERVRKP
jgi:hypothetical protein